MSDDYIRGSIHLKKSTSMDDVRLAFYNALGRVLTPEELDGILNGGDYENSVEIDDKGYLNFSLNSGFDDRACQSLAKALTPLIKGPGYFQVFDDEQSPSSDEAMFLYPLGLTQKAMRASRVLAAVDAACAILSGEKDKALVRRLRKLQAELIGG